MQRVMFFISRCDEKSGLLRHIVNLANGLVEKGFSVEILTFSGTREDLYFPLCPDVKVTSISGRPKYVVNNSTTANKENDIQLNKDKNIVKKENKNAKSIVKQFRRILSNIPFVYHRSFKKNYGSYFSAANPDVVVVWGTRRLSRAWYATRGLSCKIFDAEFNSFENTFSSNDKQNNKLLEKIDGLIVQTAREKELFSPLCNRISVINNPIIQNLPLPYNGTRQKKIVNFCRLSPQKNLELLIDAFELFHKEYPEYVLNIYGDVSVDKKSDIAYRDKLFAKISKKALEKHLFLLPGRKDIHQTVLDSAMFVSSSDYEGLSNSMLEAMAIGLPCICTDCLGGGTREVMVNRKNGLIVPMNDPKAMYLAMKEFVENPELAKKCGENASKIREILSLDNIVNQWIDVLDK